MGSIDVNRSKIIKVVDIALGREQSNYAAVGHDVTGIIHGAVKINSFTLSPYFSLTVIFHFDCAGLVSQRNFSACFIKVIHIVFAIFLGGTNGNISALGQQVCALIVIDRTGESLQRNVSRFRIDNCMVDEVAVAGPQVNIRFCTDATCRVDDIALHRAVKVFLADGGCFHGP